MNRDESQASAPHLLPLTVGLWLGYMLALLSIDQLLDPRPILPPAYYVINVINALIVLALWKWGHPRLEVFLVPLAIALLSVVPAVMGQWTVVQFPNDRATGPEAVLLRSMPLQLIALILTAWQYGWRQVIVFSAGIALFTLGLHVYFYRPGGPSLLPPVTVLIIQTISFLFVGYFVSALIRRLKQQQAALAKANAQLSDYAAAVEELAISRERNRMARELHDTLAHTLSALSVQLETVKAYWEVDLPTAQRWLDRSLAATRSGLQETRRALKSLRASSLDDMGLSLALRQMAAETAARANLQFTFSAPEHPPALSPATEQCVYRVAQEAIANVAHHASATKLAVQLACNGVVALEVSDDGRGFDPRLAESAGHFGLSGMRERAQLAGGELSISSQPGRGTRVRLVIKDQPNESRDM